MESTLTLPDRNTQLLAQHIQSAVVWHLEVIDASHDGWEIVVGCVWWLGWLADDGEHGRETLETLQLLVDSFAYCRMLLTSDRELRAASNELQKVSTLFRCVLAHGREQVAYALAIKVVTVVGLDGVHES